MTAEQVRLLVVEGRDLHCAALSAAFDAEGDLQVVAQVGDGSLAVERVAQHAPDVVCVGAAGPVHDCVEVCERVKAQSPGQRVLVIADRPDAQALVAVVRAGADGYATKDMPWAALVDAVRRIHAGEAAVPPAMLGGLLRTLARARREVDEAYEVYLRLTAREKQVLGLLGEGCGNNGIAQILVISPQTARTHIQNVVRKLGAHSRLEAAAMAVEHGWLGNGHGRQG